MAYRLLHKKSSVIENGKPKLPTVDQLEHGELAINFGKGGETISIKNSDNEIISFNVTEEKFTTLTKEFEVISGRVTTFLDSESGLTETIDSLKEIQDYFAEHGTESANMMSAITKNAESIETLSSNTQTSINEINSAITKNVEALEILSSNTETAINEINSAITQNVEAITTLSSNTETAINEINSAITQNVASIEGVSTQLNINVSDIQALSADVLTHTESIETLESYVETLEQQVDENEKVVAKTLNKLNNDITNLHDLVLNNTSYSYKEITYNELKTLKEENNLIQGILYRITDYVTTTIQENTQSANHPFDIIVEALTPNTLSEDAKACLHEGDEYFKNCNLSAWEIKYFFDNDTSRFVWADETNGKGVIYYMKDEFNNETWYDFKNIQFKRDNNWLNNHKSNFKALSASTQENIYFFTFSDVSGTASITVEDDSLNKNISSTSFYPCRNNNIGVYTKDNNDGYVKYNLNNTIFIGNGAESNHIGEHNCNNTFVGIYDNYIDMNCQNNVVSSNFSYNHIGIGFNGNIINAHFNYNKIGNLFKSNQLGSFIYCNIKDNFVENNSYGSTIKYCDFGNYIQRCSDLPTMANVIFDDEVIKYPTNTYGKGLKDITLINGQNAYNVLSNLSSNTTQIIFTKKDENYQVIDNFNNSNVINYIYDLGIQETSGQAESAATNPNIATNTKISLIKYLANNKIGLIEQYIKPIDSSTIETKQIIHWDGLSKLRTLKFSNVFGGTWSLIENSNWAQLKTITLNEWENIDETFQSVETKINTNTEAITSLSASTQSAIETINSAITQNVEALETLSSNTQTAINEINSAITDNTEAITSLSASTQSAIETINSAITDNTNHILENEEVMAKTIEYLSEQIEKLKQRIIKLEEQN